MTDYSKGVVVEARKKRLSQSRDAKGDWYDVTFQLHPNDAMNTELAKWPLGTRVGLVITLIADDETTTAEPAPAAVKQRRAWNELDEREQSVLACKRPDFQTWICEKYGFVEVCERTAAAAVKEACVVKSRADLPLHTTLRYRWAALWQDFQASQHGKGEQQAAQRAAGPGG